MTDALKSVASQTAHQEFLIGVLAVSSGRRMAASLPTTDSLNPKIGHPQSTKDFLKSVMLIPTATKELCLIQLAPEELEKNYFRYFKYIKV